MAIAWLPPPSSSLNHQLPLLASTFYITTKVSQFSRIWRDNVLHIGINAGITIATIAAVNTYQHLSQSLQLTHTCCIPQPLHLYIRAETIHHHHFYYLFALQIIHIHHIIYHHERKHTTAITSSARDHILSIFDTELRQCDGNDKVAAVK